MQKNSSLFIFYVNCRNIIFACNLQNQFIYKKSPIYNLNFDLLDFREMNMLHTPQITRYMPKNELFFFFQEIAKSPASEGNRPWCLQRMGALPQISNGWGPHTRPPLAPGGFAPGLALPIIKTWIRTFSTSMSSFMR